MGILLTSLTGLIAGAGHVFSGPDHLAAIAPLAVDRRRGTWRVGLLWGLGHSGGVWLLGILALIFREALPIDLLSTWGERGVGFVLIGVGICGLRRMFRVRVHSHVHEHDGMTHAHIHVHDDRPKRDHPMEHTHGHRAAGIGALHGLAGTAHLIGVLPALLLPTRSAAAIYIFAFGVGSILAMTGFTWGMGLVANRFDRLGTRTYRLLLGTTCAAAIAIGCFWCVVSFGA